jgi:hypothetical protein
MAALKGKTMGNEAAADSKSVVGYLVPPETLAETNGEGALFEIGRLAGQPLVLVLRVEDVIEQESLHVSVWGSVDGKDWGEKALFWFPQEFYKGATPAVLDLRQLPGVMFLIARWEVNRWGRGYPRPQFKFCVEIQKLE